jgi:hypothetical protein
MSSKKRRTHRGRKDSGSVPDVGQLQVIVVPSIVVMVEEAAAKHHLSSEGWVRFAAYLTDLYYEHPDNPEAGLVFITPDGRRRKVVAFVMG